MNNIQDILEKIVSGNIKNYQGIKDEFREWAKKEIQEEYEREIDLENLINTAIPPNEKKEVHYWGKKIFYVFDGEKFILSDKVEDERNWNLYIASARIKSPWSILEKEIISFYSGRKVEDKIGLSFTLDHIDNKISDLIKLWKSESIDGIISTLENLDENNKEINEIKSLANLYKKSVEDINKNGTNDDLIKKLIYNFNFSRYETSNKTDISSLASENKKELERVMFKNLFFKTYEYLKKTKSEKNYEAIDTFVKHLIETDGIDAIKKAPGLFKFDINEVYLDASVQILSKGDKNYKISIFNVENNESNKFVEHINSISSNFKSKNYWTHRDDYNNLFDEMNLKDEEKKATKLFYFYDERKDEKGKEIGHTIMVKKNNIVSFINYNNPTIKNKKLNSDERKEFLDDSFSLLEKIVDEKTFSDQERSGSWGLSFNHMLKASEIPNGFEFKDNFSNEEYDKIINEIKEKFQLENIEDNPSIKLYRNETTKNSGYESTHLYIEIKGKLFEVQIKDSLMAWNNKYGSASHKKGMKSDKENKQNIINKFTNFAYSKNENVNEKNINKILDKMFGDFKNMKKDFYLGTKIKEKQGERRGKIIKNKLDDFKNNENIDSYLLGIRLARKVYDSFALSSGELHASDLIAKKELFYNFIPDYFNKGIESKLYNNANALKCLESITTQDFWCKKELKEIQDYIIKEIMIKNYKTKVEEYISTSDQNKLKDISKSKKEMINAISLRTGTSYTEEKFETEFNEMLINLFDEELNKNSKTQIENWTKLRMIYSNIVQNKIIYDDKQFEEQINTLSSKYTNTN
jgi:hypothetical protein